jgi:hypothetical protein
MAAEAIAGALDADDDGVVEEAVEQRGGDDGVAEHLAPFGKAAVGGEDHGAALVAGVDQLKEQVPAAGDDGEVADLVDDQQLGRQRNRMRSRSVPSRSALASEPMSSASVVK